MHGRLAERFFLCCATRCAENSTSKMTKPGAGAGLKKNVAIGRCLLVWAVSLHSGFKLCLAGGSDHHVLATHGTTLRTPRSHRVLWEVLRSPCAARFIPCPSTACASSGPRLSPCLHSQ